MKLIVPWSFPIWCHVAMFLCVCVWSKQKSISTKGSSFYASNNKIQTQQVCLTRETETEMEYANLQLQRKLKPVQSSDTMCRVNSKLKPCLQDSPHQSSCTPAMVACISIYFAHSLRKLILTLMKMIC